jgi:arginyl-tRNA synthetase
MLSVKQELLAALADALEQLSPGAGAKAAFESPKVAAHGDFACTAAMQLAKPLRLNPRQLAETLRTALLALPAYQRWVSDIDIAGPGFINIRLQPAAKQQIVSAVLQAGARFGFQAPRNERVLVEFVSANPTGPLHVGHGRQAALGDAICNLYATQGWNVWREFYYNDAGVQIATLANSTQLRARGFKPGDAGWPEAAYNGEYIQDIANDFLAGKTVTSDDRAFTASGDIDDLDSIRQFAVAYLRHEQDLDLKAFQVHFDHYYLESSLYTSGRVEATVNRLVANGKTYEQDGALWLRSTDYGDDKDRVMRKGDGSFTYFVPDVAYHIAKWERGFTKVVNIQGTDHHGTIARVRAGLQAASVGIPEGYPDYVLHTMVRVVKGGEEVKISKRAGSYVTLRDLIEWTSTDAVRFFLLSRKPDTEYTFDVDLAVQKNNDNPVYYVQYAHARIFSVLRQWIEEEAGWPEVQADGRVRIKSLLAKFLNKPLPPGHFGKKIQRGLSTLLANSRTELLGWTDYLGKSRNVAQLITNAGSSGRVSEELHMAIQELPLSDGHVRKHLAKLVRLLESDDATSFYGEAIQDLLNREVMPIKVADRLVQRFGIPSLKDVDLSPLTGGAAQTLMLVLAKYPEMLTTAAQDMAPHDVTFYLRDLAATYHSYYDAERILVDDETVKKARLALIAATAQVLHNGLAVLGVSAPTRM